MSLPLFFSEALSSTPAGLPALGSTFRLDGPDGRHAAVVRRIGPDESVIIADGHGAGIVGRVVSADKSGLEVEVIEQVRTSARPLRFVAVQALAKGERSELAIEMLTELGIDEIIPWQASRSIVRWTGERAPKSLLRWQSTVREAAKQSRRLLIPEVDEVHSTREVIGAISEADCALVLHEQADRPLGRIELPDRGTVLIIVGPEGGISNEELAEFVAAGAEPVSLGDSVLRTSTAGVVALAGLMLR